MLRTSWRLLQMALDIIIIMRAFDVTLNQTANTANTLVLGVHIGTMLIGVLRHIWGISFSKEIQ